MIFQNNTFLFKQINHFEETESTNDLAKNSKNDFNEVFITEFQTKGRGRLTRSWFSPKGENLYFSLKLIIQNNNEIYHSLFISSVAIYEILKNIYKINCEIKWPNDLLIDNKKVCGILSETVFGEKNILIIGIGINCNTIDFPDEIKNIAVSIANKIGKIDKNKLFVEIIENFEKNYNLYKKEGFNFILSKWIEYSQIVNRHIITTVNGIKQAVKVVKVDNDGYIYVDIDNKILKIISGDIEYVDSINY